MKYLLLIYHNPQARQMWESFSEEEKAEGLALYAALNNDLAASGELIVTEALEDPSAASRVSVTDGRTVAGDGPMSRPRSTSPGSTSSTWSPASGRSRSRGGSRKPRSAASRCARS